MRLLRNLSLDRLAELRRDRPRLLRPIVVRDLHALAVRDEAAVLLHANLVLEHKRRLADAAGPHPDEDALAPRHGGAEVARRAREDDLELVEPPLPRDLQVVLRAGLLHEREVHGVVHMAHRVDVPKASLDLRLVRHPKALRTSRPARPAGRTLRASLGRPSCP